MFKTPITAVPSALLANHETLYSADMQCVILALSIVSYLSLFHPCFFFVLDGFLLAGRPNAAAAAISEEREPSEATHSGPHTHTHNPMHTHTHTLRPALKYIDNLSYVDTDLATHMLAGTHSP